MNQSKGFNMDNTVHLSSELHHRLWLVYCQLKDAEADPARRLYLLEKSRAELGEALNAVKKPLSDE
ncbi:MAG TPA: hypothetical protein V6C81_28275 [Planktothrix sp.]|jgi:hypothetical protein